MEIKPYLPTSLLLPPGPAAFRSVSQVDAKQSSTPLATLKPLDTSLGIPPLAPRTLHIQHKLLVLTAKGFHGLAFPYLSSFISSHPVLAQDIWSSYSTLCHPKVSYSLRKLSPFSLAAHQASLQMHGKTPPYYFLPIAPEFSASFALLA